MPSDDDQAEVETDLQSFIENYHGLSVDESVPCRGAIHCKGFGRVSIDDTNDDVFDCEYCRLINGME